MPEAAAACTDSAIADGVPVTRGRSNGSGRAAFSTVQINRLGAEGMIGRPCF